MAEVKFNYYSDIKSKKIDWLWYPYIPYGKLTILQGDPGEGKSTFIINVAALLTKGKNMPDGFEIKHSENVIYQCAEDNLADTIKPRLICADADCSKIAYIVDENFELSFEDKRIKEAIHKTKAKLFIIDPLQAFLVQDTDMHSASKMRNSLRKLADVAERNNCAIVLVGHLNKSIGGKSLYRGLGTIDIAAIARSVLMIVRDSNSPGIRYMTPIKSSLAPEGDAIGFTFKNNSGIQWLGKCEITSDDIKGLNVTAETKQEQAKRILTDILSAEDLPSTFIINHLEKFGISQRTTENAKAKTRISAYRKNGTWYWHLEDYFETEDGDNVPK